MFRLILDKSRTSPSPRSSGSWISKKIYQLPTCIKKFRNSQSKSIHKDNCYVNLMIYQIELLLICSVSFVYHATGVLIMDVFYFSYCICIQPCDWIPFAIFLFSVTYYLVCWNKENWQCSCWQTRNCNFFSLIKSALFYNSACGVEMLIYFPTW